MDTDYFEQRIKTDDTNTTTDDTDGHGFFGQRIKTDDTDFTNYSLEREFDVIGEFDDSGIRRPQIALMDTDYFEQRIKTDDTDFTDN